jgi:hypothetical protein
MDHAGFTYPIIFIRVQPCLLFCFYFATELKQTGRSYLNMMVKSRQKWRNAKWGQAKMGTGYAAKTGTGYAIPNFRNGEVNWVIR